MNQQKTEIQNPLGYEKIPVLLRKFATPSIIAMLVSSLYNVVDQLFIGQGVGTYGNGATTVAFPFTTISLAIGLLIGIGSAASFSLHLGEGDRKAAEKCVGNAIVMQWFFGILYAIIAEIFLVPMLWRFGATDNNIQLAIDYMRIIGIGLPFLIVSNSTTALIRADGSPKYSMLCMVVGAIINTILDPIFIFGFGWGMKGAASATLISQIISAGMAVAYYFRFKQVKLSLKSFQIRIGECLRQLSYGLSNSLNQVAICIVQIVLNQSLKHYGNLSAYGEDIPISACGIVFKVNSLFFAVFIGLAQGSQPILGFNYGAKQYERVLKTFRMACTFAFSVGILAVLSFQIFPRQIIGFFGEGSDLYFEFAVKFMRIYLIMMPAIGIQVLATNFFAALGKPIRGVVLSLSRQILFLVPMLLIFPLFWGLDGILFTAPISDFLSCILGLVMVAFEVRRMKSYEVS